MELREPVKRYTLTRGELRMLAFAIRDYMKYCKIHGFTYPKWIQKYADKLSSDLIKMRRDELR